MDLLKEEAGRRQELEEQKLELNRRLEKLAMEKDMVLEALTDSKYKF